MTRLCCSALTTSLSPCQSRSFRTRTASTSSQRKPATSPNGRPRTAQTWTLRDGTKIAGRAVDYASRDVTIQRRRGQIFVNDRRLANLPEFYQLLLPQIVDHFERLDRVDRRGLEAWVLRQRGQPRTFQLKGIVFEFENGDEYAVPFFLLSDQDQRRIGSGF